MKILIIEDSEGDQIVLELRLRSVSRLPLDIMIVSTLKEAEDALQKNSYELIFLDKTLPDCDSIEGIVDFIKRYRPLKIVILTADQREHSIFQCLQAGALDFLLKPILRDNELERILLYAELRAENV